MFTLNLETDNQAFEDEPREVARILRCLANTISRKGRMPTADERLRLRDVNGNIVGEAFKLHVLECDEV